MLTWNDPIEQIRGLGAKRCEFLRAQGFATVGDLLLRAPLRFIDRRLSPEFSKLVTPPQGEITAVGKIESFGEKGFGKKKRLIVFITDGTGHLQGVWFNNYSYILPKIQPDLTVAFSGRVTLFDGPQMVHPQVTFFEGDVDLSGRTGLIPIYPAGEEWDTVGLRRGYWPKLINTLLVEWDGSGPYLPEETRTEEGLAPFKAAITGIHQPTSVEQYDLALRSIKFAELFHHQLLMVLLRRRRRQGVGIQISGDGQRHDKFIAGLPFELSEGQRDVLSHISSDIVSGIPMYRLLQGEVGAGKTVVAFAAAAMAADSGYQTALMAPTELLARQHYLNALELCEPAGIRPVLISGGRDADELRHALMQAALGGADLIIGTHALFQHRVEMPRLGLVIIDEQQRFGVRQRASLVKKGVRPHVLLMTATPIPRTLGLVHYGDLDISFLPPLPNLRRQVATRIVNDSQRDRVFGWLRDKLRAGHRGYLVFPVIDEGPAGLEAAQTRFDPYQRIDFKGIPMALLHGRLPIDERIKAMEAFRRGEVRLLMATAVVEVGVDVPQASLMVVENAERFGLAQLHQLRGRVGRTGKKGACVLITKERQGEPGFERLKRLEQCEDGLTLAEEDLKLRGGGEPLGARQSGYVHFRMADLALDYKLLQRAHKAAERLLDKYPDLAPFPDLRVKVKQEYRQRPRTMLAG
jgi:ATP-dependent DNA helicase RecG